jgi:hypothetical protein
MAMNIVTIFMESFHTTKGAVGFIPYRSAPAHR